MSAKLLYLVLIALVIMAMCDLGLTTNKRRRKEDVSEGPSDAKNSYVEREYNADTDYYGSDMDEYEKQGGYLGDCKPKVGEMKAAHNVCLLNWRGLIAAGGDPKTIRTQCPHFCKNAGKGCVWIIACKRCANLAKLCGKNPHLCKACIKENIKKKPVNRCPQFQLCKPGFCQMLKIRKACEDVYRIWKKESECGAKMADLSDPCPKFCNNAKKNCGWKIACKKCTLLVKLTRTSRSTVFNKQFKAIMAKKGGQRCTHYHGTIFPYWWVTGNWFK